MSAPENSGQIWCKLHTRPYNNKKVFMKIKWKINGENNKMCHI